MMTDLASLLSTTPAQLGVVANVGVGLAGITEGGMAAGSLGLPVAGPTAGGPTAFQTALTAQAPAPILPPIALVRSGSIAPDAAVPYPPKAGAEGIVAISTAPPSARSWPPISQMPASLQPAIAAKTPPVDLLRAKAAGPPAIAPPGFAPVLAKPSIAASPSTAPPVAGVAAEPDAESVLAVPGHGKLPATGNILPVGAAPKTPDDARVQVGGSDEQADDGPAEYDNAADPTAQAAPVFVAGLVQYFALIAPATLASVSAKAAPTPARTSLRLVGIGRTIAQSVRAAPGPAPTMPGLLTVVADATLPAASGAAPAPGGTASPPAAPAAALQVPARAVAVSPTMAAAPPVTLLPSPPDPAAGSPAVTLRPVVPAIAPEAAVVAPAIVTTASLLSRQPGASRDVEAKAPKPSGSAATSSIGDDVATLNAAGNMLAPPVAAALVASAPATATAPPQDFAALVDRLVEARAAAQTSAAPQQISAAVTHTQFGKVSLIFQHDNAGLSVSMTSADPGFASAAQSAIAASPALLATGHVGTGAGQPGDQSSGLSGNSGQNFTLPEGRGQAALPDGRGQAAQPDGPGQATSGPSDRGGGSFSAAGGGSTQSQAHHQPQTRPGAIAAARRPGPARAGAAGASNGIFA